MKSNEFMRKTEKYLNEVNEHRYFLKSQGLNDNSRRMKENLMAMERVLRELGFTVKSNGTAGYEIKCKWSDAPEGEK